MDFVKTYKDFLCYLKEGGNLPNEVSDYHWNRWVKILAKDEGKPKYMGRARKRKKRRVIKNYPVKILSKDKIRVRTGRK